MNDSSANSPIHDHLARIENAYYYEPGKMTVVHAQEGKIKQSAVQSSRDLICLVSGNGNRPLAEAVALLLGTHIHHTDVTQYANGEVNVRINEPVLGTDVFIIQSTTSNRVVDVNTALMELLILIRKLRLSNAKSVSVIVPYFAYSRQDRRTELRGPISASAVAKMIVKMGADRVTTLDLHSNQIQGFFENVPLDNMTMSHEFGKYLKSRAWFKPEETVIVSPDAGGVERARILADIVGVGGIVTILKRRIRAGEVETLQTVGEVKGLTCVIVDDMVDTGGTLVKACELLRDLGAVRVCAFCTHGILTHPCAERINKCQALEELVVSDSIPQEQNQRSVSKLKVLTIAPLIATVVDKYTHYESVSSLFSGPLKK